MDNFFIELLPPWVLTGSQPAFYDKESGTVLQQTSRMYKKVNELIVSNNKLGEDFIKLKQYIDDYFDNLDVQTEVNNKLDAMVESGELADIINQEIFDDLNEEIDDVKLDLNLYKRNKKWILALFLDTATRQAIPYFTELIQRAVKAGFSECQMLIHCQADGSILEDSSKFAEYDSIASAYNIPITSIKFHGSYSYDNYLQNVLDSIGAFENLDTVFIFNEDPGNIYTYGLTTPTTIKTAYPNIKKVGFTMPYGRSFYNLDNWGVTKTQFDSVQAVYDVLGVHVYPSCSSFGNADNISYDKVLNSFNVPSFLQDWQKEIWVTESGVLPYWQMLELPENWDVTKLTNQTKTVAPQRLFYKALSESNIAKLATRIVPWFVESGMSDEKHELFEVLKSIMKGE